MGDPWQDEGFPGDDDWDDGEESLATDLEDGFDDPDESGDELWAGLGNEDEDDAE